MLHCLKNMLMSDKLRSAGVSYVEIDSQERKRKL